MDNEITINVEELLKVDDNSITDYETIRQIGLLSCTENEVSKEDRKTLYNKVKREFQYCGLYPTVMKSFDITPDVSGGSFDWDKLANALKDKFGESLVEEEYGEENPYNWWLTDVTVTDIVDFIKNYR